MDAQSAQEIVMKLATMASTLGTAFSFINGIGAAIANLVAAAEQSMPEGTGKQKFQLVEGWIKLGLSTAGIVHDEFLAIEPELENIINSIVDLFNTSGIFKHKTG